MLARSLPSSRSRATRRACPAWCGPPDLSEAARTFDDRALLGPEHQRDLQLPISFIVKVSPKCGRKHVRLDEPHQADDTPLA